MDLSRNEFFSLPSGIGILSKLRLLTVEECRNLVSIPELPSNLEQLDTFGCRSMQWVRLPIQAKKNLSLLLYGCRDLIEIEGMEGLSNHGWFISSVTRSKISNNCKRSLVEVLFLSLLHSNKHTIGTYYIYMNECVIYTGTVLRWLRVSYSLQSFVYVQPQR